MWSYEISQSRYLHVAYLDPMAISFTHSEELVHLDNAENTADQTRNPAISDNSIEIDKLTLFKATSTFPPALRQLIKIACILTPFLSQHHENVQMHIDEENVMQLLAIWQDSLTMDVP